VKLGQRRSLPVIHDIGSGLLRAMPDTLLSDEPDASSSIAAGADLVLFSGDKLLGGPQCGIIIGRSKWIDLIEKNPLARAMRVDKLTLAALGATLQLHQDPGRARRALPIYQMLDWTIEQLEERGARIVSLLSGISGIDAAPSVAFLGGGSMPNRQVPSVAIRIGCGKSSLDDLARRLRAGVPPVIGRIQQDKVWLDLRTIMPSQDEMLVQAIQTAIGGH
jgi:L-seryl-tRNA(Ser) seleniumtransferase